MKIDAAAYFLVPSPTVYRSTRGLNHITRKQQRVFCFDEVY